MTNKIFVLASLFTFAVEALSYQGGERPETGRAATAAADPVSAIAQATPEAAKPRPQEPSLFDWYVVSRPLGDRERCRTPNEAYPNPLRDRLDVKGDSEAARAKMQALMEARMAALAEAVREQPAMDMAIFSIPQTYPRPRSGWRTREMAVYEALLLKGQFDVLVVPFQVQLLAVDRATRSLMSAVLAATLATAQKVRIPDPYLVARALGDGERCFAPEDISRLAQSLGVKRIVHGYVGHERTNEIRITIQVEERGARGDRRTLSTMRAQQFEHIRFSDETPPIEAYLAALPDVLKFLGADPSVLNMRKPESRFTEAGLPPSPLLLTGAALDPARDAHFLQLLAALAPKYGDRTRERLIEKSMIALYAMAPSSPEYRLLKARALMHLGLRPAANSVLGSPKTPDEQHLLAVLNGNLPDAEKHAGQIRHKMKALIAWLEVNEMRAAYKVTTRTQSLKLAESLKLPGQVWPFLAMRAMTDWDQWSQYENIALKALLDIELPVAGLTAEGIVRGAASLGDFAKAQAMADLSVLNHARKLLESAPNRWCCAPVAGPPSPLDYVDLLEATGTDNLVRRAKFLNGTQATPEQALEFLARIESAYKDHPQMTLARAQAEFSMMERADSASKEGLARSAYTGALNAMFWEQGQTRTSADAFNLRASVGRRDYGYIDNIYASDYPFRSYYPDWEQGGNQTRQEANLRAALNNSTWDFGPVKKLAGHLSRLEQGTDKAYELLDSLKGRFAGNPELLLDRARSSARKGDIEAAENHYRATIQMRPSSWQAHDELGKMFFERGQVAQAAEIFAAYPGFRKEATENHVSVSNHAFEAGSLFYWSGHFVQALPLYRIASDLQTGSDASLSSEIRIALMGSDYATAMKLSLDRARRYNSNYAYRDYLGMLHASGHSREAWNAFNVLVAQSENPQIWETALVGHRLAGAGEADIAAWAGQNAYRKAGRAFGFAPMYLLRAGVTDRMPSSDLALRIAAIDRPVWRLEGDYRHVVRPSIDSDYQRILGPVAPGGSWLISGLFARAQKTQIKSDLVRFAEAYRAMRTGDYAGARATLQEAVALFDTVNVSLGYLLPYYAYAAAKSGDASAVQAVLDKFSIGQQRFDYHLAKAVIAALRGRPGEAHQSLTLALHRRPHTENRPLLTEYQFAEICEWIYEATQDAKIGDLLLNWAKANQTFQPWFAWAYALEAKLTRSPPDRQRAIALAYYLDRNSERLASIAKREIDAAVKEFSNKNPFLPLDGREKAKTT